jgi:hypothetical protein
MADIIQASWCIVETNIDYFDKPLKGSLSELNTLLAQQHGHSGQTRILGDLLWSDPIYWLVRKFHLRLTALRQRARYVDKSFDALHIPTRNPIYLGFSKLAWISRRSSRHKYSNVFPSWNARRSLSLAGVFGSAVTSTVGVEFSPSFAYPAGVNALTFYLTRFIEEGTGQTRNHLSFEMLYVFCRKLEALSGRYYNRSVGSLGRYSYHTLSSLTVSHTEISYTLSDIFYQSYPASKTMRCSSLTVVIRKEDGGYAKGMSISISGLDNVKVDNVVPNPKIPWISYGMSSSPGLTNGSATIDNRYVKLALSSQLFHASDFRPAFYFTQAEALSKVALAMSANFENFVESPELLALMGAFLSAKNSPFAKAFVNAGAARRIKLIADLISGAILLWNFALRPTLDAVKELASNATMPLRGEASMGFHGEDIAVLPASLLDLLTRDFHVLGLASTDIARYEITFRTTVTTTINYNQLASALMEQLPLLRLQILPSPSQIWAAAPASFLVDMNVQPISRFLEAHEAYVQSAFMPIRVGHTASIRLFVKQGFALKAFLRSTEVNTLCDPPGEAWLASPGPQAILLPLGFSVLF